MKNAHIFIAAIFIIAAASLLFSGCKTTSTPVVETNVEPVAVETPETNIPEETLAVVEPIVTNIVTNIPEVIVETPPPEPAINTNEWLSFNHQVINWPYKNWDIQEVKAQLDKEAPAILAQLTNLPPGWVVHIVGHTDGRGPETAVAGQEEEHPGNEEIGRRRAQAVADYFVTYHNIPRNIFVIETKGETQLRDPAHPYNAINRRVEIYYRPAAQ